MVIPPITAENTWKIYYYIAIFSTILFVLKLLLFSVVGGDSEVSADFNTETDTDCSFNFLSIQSVIAFFMGFGWMGYAGLQQFSFNHLVNILSAFSVGLIFMFTTAFLMFLTKKLEKNIKKDKTEAINRTGKAYTNFAPHSNGQIEIEINGQLSIENAFNDSDEEIKAFEMVKVTKVADNLLYISK